MAKHKCPICKEEIGEEYKTYKKRRYHINCYKKMVNELYRKDEEAKPSKDKLIEYICEKYNLEGLTGMMDAQLKKYLEEKEYRYEGMLATLKYYFETLENDYNEKIKGLGIIPLYYDEAKKFFIFKNEKLKGNRDVNVINKTIETMKKDYKLENKFIDIDNIV